MHNEVDIDTELCLTLEAEVKKSLELKFDWKSSSENENTTCIVFERLSFFIMSGRITAIQKKEIKEAVFHNGTFSIIKYNSQGDKKNFEDRYVKWTLNYYFILKYHLLNILLSNLTNSHTLNIDLLAKECFVDKGFLINFIYAFINKTLLEFSYVEDYSVLKITENLREKSNELANLLAEMEFNLAS